MLSKNVSTLFNIYVDMRNATKCQTDAVLEKYRDTVVFLQNHIMRELNDSRSKVHTSKRQVLSEVITLEH